MRTTQQLSITLPNDMADIVKNKVRSGEYAGRLHEGNPLKTTDFWRDLVNLC